MRNIVLAGFMGTGKTAVGRELSRMLDMKIVDIDGEIERAEKVSINEIFGTRGEKFFRDLETEMIRRYSEQSNLIISTGGGAVLREENMELLRKNGIVFCLSATAETIFSRTKDSGDRPLLNVPDPMAKIRELLDFRMPYYEKAGTVIHTDGLTPFQVAERIKEEYTCRR